MQISFVKLNFTFSHLGFENAEIMKLGKWYKLYVISQKNY